MTEIVIEDDAVNVSVENVLVELGDEVAGVEIMGPVLYGLPGVNVVAPLVFDSIGGNFTIAEGNASHDGFISAEDWVNFNGKQTAGNYITSLTGDASASGPGSAALTLANVNSNIGTFNNLTVNAKGQVTAASSVSYQPAYAAFGANKVLFGDGTATPAGSADLIWDNTNKRLGVGTTPGKALDVSGDVRASNTMFSGSGGFSQTGGTLGTFGDPTHISLKPDSGYTFNFGSNGNTQWQTDLSGNLLPTADNSYNIGSSGNQISNGYFRNKIGLNAFGTSSWTPTAGLHLNAKADGTAGSAPLKISGGGTLLTSAEDGAMEYNGTHLYYTIGIQRYQLDRQTAKTKTTAADANTSILAVNTLTILPTPTANRTLTLALPLLYTGEEIIIWNKSTSGTFVWTFGTGARDSTGTTLTTLANQTIYRMVCDGSVWVKTN